MKTLDEMGIHYAYTKGTIFMWVRVPEGYTSAEYAEKVLMEAHVIVAAGTAYGPDGEGWIRLSLATEDDRLVEALDRMSKLK